MLISQILAWLTVIFTLMEVLKFFARVSKKPKLNKFFHKIHIPFGILLLITGGLHGILAGNFPYAKLSEIELCPVLFTLNPGTICYVFAILLGITYLLRKKLKKKWMTCHRILTVLMVLATVLHIINVGISLPKRFTDNSEAPVLPKIVLKNEHEDGFGHHSPERPDGSPFHGTDRPDHHDRFEHDNRAPSEAPEDQPEAYPEVIPETPAEAAPADEPEVSTGVVIFSGAELADGIYEGTGRGYDGSITVSVTVEGGQVTDIEVVSQRETPRFFQRAINVLSSIISSQSLEVNAVSGATYSSDGLKSAVYDALEDAVISGELKIR